MVVEDRVKNLENMDEIKEEEKMEEETIDDSCVLTQNKDDNTNAGLSLVFVFFFFRFVLF